MGIYRGKVLYGFVFPTMMIPYFGLDKIESHPKIHTMNLDQTMFFGVLVNYFTVYEDVPQIPDESLENAHETLVTEFVKFGLSKAVSMLDMSVIVVPDPECSA